MTVPQDQNETPTTLAARTALEKRLLSGRRGKSRSQAIPTLPRDRPLPFSPAQRSFWFGHLTQSDPSKWNVFHAERLRGPLDVEKLAAAVDQSVHRHEPLRQCLIEKDGEPFSVPSENRPTLRHEDATDVQEDYRAADILRRAEAAAAEPFDLLSEPPFRAILVRYDAQDHLLVFVIHHIACDEVSLRLLRQEILSFQKTEHVATKAPPLLQYADIAAWDRQQDEAGAWRDTLERWQGRLQGAGTEDTLPPDLPRNATRGQSGRLDVLLQPEDIAAVDAAALAAGATPFVAMASAAMCLLHSHCDRSDLSIATQLAGRSHPGAAKLVGPFTNTGILRSKIAPDQTFAELVEDMRAQTHDLLAHQNVRFERLLHHLGLGRDASTAPFCRLMFTHRRALSEHNAPYDLISEPVAFKERAQAKFDLWISLIDEKEGRKLRLIYDTSLYSPERILTLADGFIAVLRDVAGFPEISLSALLEKERERAGMAADNPLPDLHLDPPVASPLEVAQDVSETTELVAHAWTKVLGHPPTDPQVSFFDAGGDSLSLMRLVHLLEEQTGLEVPLTDAFHSPKPARLARLLEELQRAVSPTTVGQWDTLVEPFQTDASRSQVTGRPHFFYVAGGGGHVAPFTSVVRRIAASWEGFGILDPALFESEPQVTRVEELAARMAQAILTVNPRGPFVLVGYSAGGRAVYEAARILRQNGFQAGCIILDAGPGLLKGTSLLLHPLRRLKLALRTTLCWASDMWVDRSSQSLDETEQLRRKYRRIALLQHARLLRHRCRTSDVPVLLIRAATSHRSLRSADYGWSHIADLVEVFETQGNHFTIYTGPREKDFAALFRRALDCMQENLVTGSAEVSGGLQDT